MLNYFKQSFLSQQIVIVVMAVLLWLPTFLTKSAFISGGYNTALYNAIIYAFQFSPFIINVLAFAVYVVCVFLFNSVLSANRLLGKNSSIASLMFVLMTCVSPDLSSSYPFIFACPFILMSMHTLFLIYQTENPENYMMNIGYFIAIASLFYYPSVFLMIWVVISFIIMKFSNIRYLLIPVVGFMIINIIVLGISFLLGNVSDLIDSYSSFFRNISFSFDLTYSDLIFASLTTLMFLLSLVMIFGSENSDRSTHVRKRIAVAIVLTILSVIMFFVQKPLMDNLLIFVMYALFYAVTLSEIKKTHVASIMVFLLALYVLANQYLVLFGIII